MVHFGAFWWTSCATPWPLDDLLRLLHPFKCPFIPEMDYISHSAQIRKTLLCHAMDTILVHFGAFWSTSCATPWPIHDLLWLLYPFKCAFVPEMDHISHSEQVRNALLSHGTVTILVHFSAFWSIFGVLRGWPHHPSILNFHQVIKNMYPTHQELLNATNPTFLSREILI